MEQKVTEHMTCLAPAYRRWPALKSVIIDFIQRFLEDEATSLNPELGKANTEVLEATNRYLGTDPDGQILLANSNLKKIIDVYLNKLDARSQAYTAAQNIYRFLSLEIRWRSSWPSAQHRPLAKTLRWLTKRGAESSTPEDVFYSSEYAEIDSSLKHSVIEHPLLKQVKGPFPSIVFGGEGMGKSAAAIWLAEENRVDVDIKPEENNSLVFPVYAPFEARVNLKEWLVDKFTRALVDFTADNPRRFLNAPETRKTAMGRLMLRSTRGLNPLRLKLKSTPFCSQAEDTDQVIDYLHAFNMAAISGVTKDEMLNLLFMAYPDIFEQIYFLWDIGSTAPEDEVLQLVTETGEIVCPMAAQGFYIKIFAPSKIKEKLRGIPGFQYPYTELTWDDELIRTLIHSRLRKFESLWDQAVTDPIGQIVSARGHSPRGVIRCLNRLLEYADGQDNLQEDYGLNQSDLNQILKG